MECGQPLRPPEDRLEESRGRGFAVMYGLYCGHIVPDLVEKCLIQDSQDIFLQLVEVNLQWNNIQ